MKKANKILSLILSIIIILGFSTSCFYIIMMPSENAVKGLPAFALSEEDVKKANSLLVTAETTVLSGGSNMDINTAWAEFLDYYYFVSTQANIGYIWNSTDTTNETYQKNYLFAQNSATDLYTSYTETLKKIYNSDKRDTFFVGWSQEDIDAILKHDDEVANLEKANNSLTVEYSALSDSEFYAKSVDIYKQIAINNNKIAKKFGYNNFYEYAHRQVYARDYSFKELADFRSYASTQVAPLAIQTRASCKAKTASLNQKESELFSEILTKPYDKTSVNYWDKYVESYDDISSRAKFNHAFANSNVSFISGANARDGAFTAYLPTYNKSFCYFGPSYQDLFTVGHEIGHYYAGMYSGLKNLSMDLKETHSQSNEMLILEFLEDELSNSTFDVLEEYTLGNALTMVAVCAMVDEFEYKVYTNGDLANFTANNFDSLMAEVCVSYGGIDYVNSNFANINNYWRRVVVEQPVYYISYATSSIASIGLYVWATDDRAEARKAYSKLVELPSSDGFTSSLEKAGFLNPFEQSTITKISNYLKGDKAPETEGESSLEVVAN